MEAYKFIKFNQDGTRTVVGIAILPTPGKDKEVDADLVKELRNKKVDSIPVRYQGDSMILEFGEVLAGE